MQEVEKVTQASEGSRSGTKTEYDEKQYFCNTSTFVVVKMFGKEHLDLKGQSVVRIIRVQMSRKFFTQATNISPMCGGDDNVRLFSPAAFVLFLVTMFDLCEPTQNNCGQWSYFVVITTSIREKSKA